MNVLPHSKITQILKIFAKKACFCFPLILFLFLLGSCTSVDQKEAYVSINQFRYSCVYNEGTDETKVVWSAPIANNTIYRINGITFSFDFYESGTLVRGPVKISYSASIAPGKSDSDNWYFTCYGKIDEIRYRSWHASYDNLWDTYLVWWIVIIVAVPVIALIYLLIVVIMDLDIEDVFESIGSWIGLGAIVLIPLVINFISSINNWFPYIIALIGVTSLVLLCLLASGVKVLTENLDLGFLDTIKDSIRDRAEMRAVDKINACDNNKDLLMSQTTKTLAYYCDAYGVKVKSYSKIGMVDAIYNFNKAQIEKEEAEKEEAKEQKKSKKVSSKKNAITFKDIAGLENAKEAFREKVILPFEHQELFKKFGKKAGGGILLYGLPGTGKTMFAEACSNEADALFIPVKCSDIKSKWYGESEKQVKSIFEKARKAKTKKAIIFFDEFEAIGSKRTDDNSNGNNDLVPEILAEMQGVGSYSSDSIIVTIAATNKPWAIDSAFLRPGRFDQRIYIPLPDFEARKKLFELKLKGIPTDGLDFDVLAKITENYNGADITEFVERLKMKVINKSIKEAKEESITMQDVYEIAKDFKSSVSLEDVQKLELFEKN